MNFSRRQFIKASMAISAASAFPSIWLRAREASALQSCEMGVNLVIVHLEGGNDGINMVVPMSNGTGQNRSAYDAVRTQSGVGLVGTNIGKGNVMSVLGPTQVGDDPLHTSGPLSRAQLALHPHMTGLKSLYDSQNLAVVCGVQFANPTLSHDTDSNIWYRGASITPGGQMQGQSSGWIGRLLDSNSECGIPSSAVPAVDLQSQLTPLFYGNTSVFSFDSIGDLNFPTSDRFDGSLDAAYKAAFAAIYNNAAAAGANFTKPIGTSGGIAAAKVDAYSTANEDLALNLNDLINDTANGSGGFGLTGLQQTGQSFGLARRLRTAFALMKGQQPGNAPLGCRIFRVNIGGFDSHSDQGGYIPGSMATKIQNGFPGEQHGELMYRIDRALSAFWADCVADGTLHKNTVMMTFSEFGRRVAENGDPDPLANKPPGTDHGTAAPLFVIGPNAAQQNQPGVGHVAGGTSVVYGAYPEIDDPNLDDGGNPAFQLDFRHVYGEIIEKWLGLSGQANAIIDPQDGFSYTPQGIIV